MINLIEGIKMGGLDSNQGSDAANSSGGERQQSAPEGLCKNLNVSSRANIGSCLGESLNEPVKIDYFQKLENEFRALGINFRTDAYRAAYSLFVKKENRLPMATIYARLEPFFSMARTSKKVRGELHKRKKELTDILSFYFLAKDVEAEDAIAKLLVKIDTRMKMNDVENAILERFAKEFSENSRGLKNPKNKPYFEWRLSSLSAKKEIISSYVRKKRTYFGLKSNIEKIFACDTSVEIRDICKKLKVEVPSSIADVETAESKMRLHATENEISAEIAANPNLQYAYQKLESTGKAQGKDQEAIAKRLRYEGDQLIDESNNLVGKIQKEADFFEKILGKYFHISKMPENKRAKVERRLRAYISMLNYHTEIQSKLLSIGLTYDIIGARPQKTKSDSEERSWDDLMKDMREEAQNSNRESKMVAEFLEIKEYKVPDVGKLSVSKAAIGMIQNETSDIEKKYRGVMDGVVGSYKLMQQALETFEKAQKDPDWADSKNLKLSKVFDSGIYAVGKTISSIYLSRTKFEGMQEDLSKLLFKIGSNESPLLKAHPQFKEIYKAAIENSFKQVYFILNDPSSPISKQQIEKLERTKEELKRGKEEYLDGVLKSIAVFTLVMATAIVGGIAGAYAIQAITHSSSIFIISVGTSAGGVIGSRVGMTATNAIGVSKFENIWNPKSMGEDFVTGYFISLAALFAAKGAIGVLKTASLSKNAKVASGASKALGILEKAKRFTSPFEGRQAKNALKEFGVKFTEEYAEETIEEGTERISPILSFFVSVINSSNSGGVRLAKAGVGVKKIGISTEHGHFTYGAKTPAEFIANLKAQFAGKKGSSFDATVNDDGTIYLSIYGETLSRSIAEITIHPSAHAPVDVPTASQNVRAKVDAKKSLAITLAQKISDSAIGKMALEIVDELFGSTMKKSKDTFLKTAEKFKSISTYLKLNAKELASVFHAKFMKQGVVFGMGGTQVLQLLYDTVVDFATGNKKNMEMVKKINLSPYDLERDVGNRIEVGGVPVNFHTLPEGFVIKLSTRNGSPIGEIFRDSSGLILRNNQRNKFIRLPLPGDINIGFDNMEPGFFGNSEPKISGSHLNIFAFFSGVDGDLNVVVKDIGSKNGTSAQLAVGEQHVQNKPQENLDPVKRPLRNSQDIINEYFSRSRQFLLTEKLVHDGIFRVEKTIILDGKKFHIGPVFKDIDGRLLSTMMVDSGNGKLYPRLLYQSDSGGGWMSTRGYALRMDKSGRIFKKGALSMKVSFQGRDYVYPAAYTETQVHSEIAEYLQTQRDASISYRGNFALDYFDLENPSVKETNTYSPIAEARERGAPEVGDTEVDFAVPESYIIRDSLGNEPQYMPAKLNMPGSENAGAYFKGLDHKFPQGFIPDFSVGPIRQPTIKYHTQLGKTISGIYRGYLNGKKVDWTMVYESPDNPRYEGRVWIENIRMTDSGLTTYGTYSNYLFTSILGHKPLDYSDQVSKLRMGIDRKTYSFDGNTGEPFYDDITPLLDNLLPIRLFRRARGIYRP